MAARAPRARKITISVSTDLVDFVDRKAVLMTKSRSQVVSEYLASAKESEQEALAAEGYHFYAKEAADFAKASARAVAEATNDVG